MLKFGAATAARLVLLSICCSCVLLHAQENTLSPGEQENGWILLFDGSARGWRSMTNDVFPSASWLAQDGCLKTVAKRGNPGIDLVSTFSYEYFEMTFDWRLTRGANTGIKYLIQDYRFDQPFRTQLLFGPKALGFEFQLVDNEHDDFAPDHPNQRAGSLYYYRAPVRDAAKPVGEWNTGRLVVTRGRVEHWINGSKVVEYDPDSPELTRAIEAAVMDPKIPGLTLASARTLIRRRKPIKTIALQHHSSEVSFRNLKVRVLNP